MIDMRPLKLDHVAHVQYHSPLSDSALRPLLNFLRLPPTRTNSRHSWLRSSFSPRSWSIAAAAPPPAISHFWTVAPQHAPSVAPSASEWGVTGGGSPRQHERGRLELRESLSFTHVVANAAVGTSSARTRRRSFGSIEAPWPIGVEENGHGLGAR